MRVNANPMVSAAFGVVLLALGTVGCGDGSKDSGVESEGGSPTANQSRDVGRQCPDRLFGGSSTSKEAALKRACSDADDGGLHLENYRFNVIRDDGETAQIEVLADQNSCESECPRYVSEVIESFVNSSGSWEAKRTYEGFSEPESSVRSRIERELASATVSFASTAGVGGRGNTVDFPVTYTGEFASVEVVARFDGGTVVMYKNRAVDMPFMIGSSTPDTEQYFTLDADYLGYRDHEGENVRIIKYRVVSVGVYGPDDRIATISSNWVDVP